MTRNYRILTCDFCNRMNKLDALPRGFGALPVLEVLDLTYNNLNENSLPGNFFMMGNLSRIIGNYSPFSERSISSYFHLALLGI